MAILMTDGEGEAQSQPISLVTTPATVDRRGGVLGHPFYNSCYSSEVDLDEMTIKGVWKRTSSADLTGLSEDTAYPWRRLLTIHDHQYNAIAYVTAFAPASTPRDRWNLYLGVRTSAAGYTEQHTLLLSDETFYTEKSISLSCQWNVPDANSMTVTVYIDEIHVTSAVVSKNFAGGNKPSQARWGVTKRTDSPYPTGRAADDLYLLSCAVSSEAVLLHTQKMSALRSTAVGSYTDAWRADGTTPAIYGDVSEEGVDSSTVWLFDTDASGDRQSLVLYPLSGKTYSGEVIDSLVFTIVAKRQTGSATYDGFLVSLRIGGVLYDVATIGPLTDSLRAYTVNVATNPSTSIEWTAAQLLSGVEVVLTLTNAV